MYYLQQHYIIVPFGTRTEIKKNISNLTYLYKRFDLMTHYNQRQTFSDETRTRLKAIQTLKIGVLHLVTAWLDQQLTVQEFHTETTAYLHRLAALGCLLTTEHFLQSVCLNLLDYDVVL